jgi:RND family efflux transporter MFP subunit
MVALALTLALGACGKDDDGAAHAEASPPPPTVTVAQPLVKPLTEYDEFTGRFEPFKQVDIRARVSGYLRSIGFEDGQIVEKGQLLFVVDPRPYQVAVEQAQAAIDGAKARAQLAQLELDRANKLVSSSALSRATLDQRLAEKRQTDADLAAAVAHLDQAKLDLGYTEVRSPIKGRISDRRVDIGNLVAGDPNPTLLTTIVALDPIYFVFDMSETEFLGYQRAVLSGKLPSTRDHRTPIAVRLTDEETWAHPGTMDFVDNEVDQGTGTLRARAIVDNPDHFITPGQFGRLRLPGSPEYPAMLIPDSAIVTDQSRKVVLTVGKDDVVTPRVIRPGPHELGLRVVRKGLEAGDRIIIDGLMRARPGAKVTPQPGKIEPTLSADAG